MKILGITGGVGAGKSTVLDFLKEKYHAYVILADLVGHLVMEPDGICYDSVVTLFGKRVIKNDKTIDRKMVSDIVFGSEVMRQSLDAIIHPAVRQFILNQIEQQREAGCSLVVVEAALLLEEKYDAFCGQVCTYGSGDTYRTSYEQQRLHKRKSSEHHKETGFRGVFPAEYGLCDYK